MKVLRLSQRLGDKYREHGDKEDRDIVKIPEPALRICIGNGKLDRAQEKPQHHQHRNRQQIALHLRLHNADPDRVAPCAQQEDINSAAQMVINRRMEHRSAGITKPHGKRDKPQRGKRIQKALFCRFTHSVLLPAPRIQMQYIMQTGKEQCGFGRFAESGKGIWPGTENKCKPYPIGGGAREDDRLIYS